MFPGQWKEAQGTVINRILHMSRLLLLLILLDFLI